MGRAVPAVTRALDILELFLERPSLTAPEITGGYMFKFDYAATDATAPTTT